MLLVGMTSQPLCALISAGTLAPLSYTHDGFEVTITDCETDHEGAIEIPALIEDLPVHTIADSAFEACTSITDISLPDTVQHIEKDAFKGCMSLAQIDLPIDLTQIGDQAFRDCRMLESITIPDAVTQIEARTFERCYVLDSVTLPASLQSIGDFAFKDCYELDTITLPSQLSSMGVGIFSTCVQLQSIDLSADNTYFSVIDGVLFDSTEATLVSFPRGRDGSYVIPEGTTTLKPWAFNGAAYIDAIHLPTSLSSLGEGCFYRCIELQSLTIPEGVATIPDYCFEYCWKLETISFPSSVNTIEPVALRFTTTLRNIEVASNNPNYSAKDGVLIDDQNAALVRYPPMKTGDAYSIPASILRVEDYAFEDNQLLTWIHLPERLTSIGFVAFADCEQLASITIPSTVTSIEAAAFSRCAALTSVYFLGDIPSEIKWNAFAYNDELVAYHFEGAEGFATPSWTYYDSSAAIAAESLPVSSRTPFLEWMLRHGYAHDKAPSHLGQSGYNLLAEYALDIGYTGSAEPPQQSATPHDFSLSFHPERADVTYTVQSSENLEKWDTDKVTLSPIDADGYRTASIPIESRGFLRIALELTP